MNGIIASGVVTSDGRPVVAQSPYAYALSETVRFVGQKLVCGPGTSTHDLRLSKAVRLQGASYWAQSPSLGDDADFLVVDLDNVLGGGAGAVVSTYVVGLPLMPWSHQADLLASTAGPLPAGLVLRVVYRNVASNAVHLGITYRWFEDPSAPAP